MDAQLPGVSRARPGQGDAAGETVVPPGFFYEQVLGLRLIEHDDFACVFDAKGTMPRVTAVADVGRPGYTVLGWRVPDIAVTVRGLAAEGVVFLRYDGMDQDESGVWTSPAGAMVAWFCDPDGNVLSLTQFARGLPASQVPPSRPGLRFIMCRKAPGMTPNYP